MAFSRLSDAHARPSVAQPRSNSTQALPEHIEGGFRKITTHQLVLAWWLYREAHITRRQLRVWFALHEMAERRSACSATTLRSLRKQPSFALDELSALVGGKSRGEALLALQGDLRRLKAVGLATLSAHQIDFATAIDQITVPDVSGFHAMLAQFQNRSRAVPVPRRMLRALAAGFGRATTGVVIAMLIRSLFWHNERGYRVDGRTKGSWIAEAFGISRRAVTDARAKLIELGWLQPLETEQWKLNKWGAHDAINAAWTQTTEQSRAESEFASPPSENRTEIASPDLNSSPSTKILKTRNPARPDLAGFSTNNGTAKKTAAIPSGAGVELRDVKAEHLASTDALLALREQAIAVGLINSSEASLLEFFAYAERARAHGARPGALFMWLLRGKRTEFITQADEDAAHARLREHRNGRAGERTTKTATTEPRMLSDDEKFYLACVQVSRKENFGDPYRVAYVAKKWTRAHWEEVQATYQLAQKAQSFTRIGHS